MPDEQPKPVAPRPRRWRDQDVRAAKDAQAGSRRVLFRLLLALMAMLGAFLAWLLFLRPTPSPAFLSFSITQYTDPRWPVNALAEQDSQHLLAPFQASQGLGESLFRKPRRGEMFTSQVRLRLVEELKKLRDHHDRGQAVIVHLACLARTDAQGEVFLLPADAKPDDPETWVALSDVLGWVEACPARNKLLILDVMRPVADPRLGILANDVAGRVQDLLEKKKPTYFVLGACSRGQVALVWEAMGQSVFGHYLEEGLQGAAGRYGAGGHEGVVRVSGLADFVTRRVARWAARLEMVQTPFLWKGQAKDFVLRAVSGQPPASKDYPDLEYLPELRAGWERWGQWHDSRPWQDAPVARTAPLTFRELEASLLQAEQRWRGGSKDAGGRMALTLTSLEQREGSRGADRFQPTPPSLTLIAARQGIKADPADVKLLQDALDKVGTGPDAAKKEAEVRKEVLKAKQKQWKDKEARDIALAVWEVAAAEDAPDPCQRAVYLNEWYQALYSSATPYIETLFLQRLGNWAKLKPHIAQEMVGAVRKAFQTVREGEAALGNARALPWTRQLLQQAEEKRGQGENSLFAPTWAQRQNAQDLLEQALRDLDAVRQVAATVTDAWATRDRALDLLPEYPAYLMKRLDYNLGHEHEAAWLDAVDLTDKLDRELTNAPGETPPKVAFHGRIDRIQRLNAQLVRRLEELSTPLTGEYVRKLSEPTYRNLAELDALLALPWAQARERSDLTPEEQKALTKLDREAVWKQRRQLAKSIFEETRRQDAAEDAGTSRTKPPDNPDPEELRRRERDRAIHRARLAVGMLRLGGFKGAESLAEELTAAEQDPAVDLYVLGGKFFAAWSREMPQQLADLKLENPQQLAAADRLSRVLFPLNADWPWRPADGPDSPTGRRRRQEKESYWKWLGAYYQGKSRRSEGPAKDFYRNAAAEYLR